MDPRIQQVVAQQRQLSRQVDMYEWGSKREDVIEDVDMMPSQAIRDTVEELDNATIYRAIATLHSAEDLMDLLDLVKGTFRGSTRGLAPVNDSAKLELRRRNLFLELLKVMMQSHIKQEEKHNIFCTQLVEILRREIDILDMTSLPLLIEHILHSVEQAYRNQEENQEMIPIPIPSVELLPHLLGRMLCFAHAVLPPATVSNWDFNEGDPWTGSIYVGKVLDRLMKARWPQQFISQMVVIFREVPLSTEQQAQLCRKFLAQVEVEMSPSYPEAQPDYAVLPTLLHQLQLFVQNASKSLKYEVVSCWMHYLLELALEADRVDAPARQFSKSQYGAQELRAIQATMLYQLDKLLHQDDSLGALLLDQIQSREWTSTHISVLFILRNHSKHQTAVDKLLLECIGKRDKDDVLPMFLSVASSSGRGQMESLVVSAVQVGFAFLASGMKNVAEVGVDMIRHTFHQHAFARASVIDMVVNLLLITKQATAGHSILELAHIKLLATLVESCLLDFDHNLLERVRELIEYLPEFPVVVAVSLLAALAQVLRQKMHLRNALILTMRKAMFKRGAPARIVAIHGLCAVLECAMHANNAKPIYFTQRYKSAHHASQVIMSQSQSVIQMDSQDVEQGNVVSVFRQFASLFRKALTCQRSVREALYIQLKLVVKQCPDLRNCVLELLWPHMKEVIEPNEALSPPVYLKDDDAIPLLLDTLLACEAPLVPQLMERMKNVEMEDFELDKTSVVVQGSPTYTRAKQVIQLCDVALNHIWEQDRESEMLSLDQRMQSLKLIEVRHKVQLLMKAQNVPKKGKGKGSSDPDKASKTTSGAREAPTEDESMALLIHHRSITIVLQSMVKNVDSNLNAPVAQECVLQMTTQLMKHWRAEQDQIWLQAKPTRILRLSPRMQEEYLTLLIALLWKIAEDLLDGARVDQPSTESTAGNKKTGKPKECPAESLQSVSYKIIHLIFAVMAPRTDKLLGPMLGKALSFEKLALELQKKVFSLIRDGKEVEAHLILQLLVEYIFPSFSDEMTERAQKWMEAMCASQVKMTHLPLVTLFVNTLLRSPLKLLLFANEIKRHLADEESGDEEDAEGKLKLSCINTKTIGPITTMLVEALERGMHKVEAGFKGRSASQEPSQESLYLELTSISQCCAPLMLCSFPSQAIAARVVRTMLRLYKLCTSVIQRRLRAKDTTVREPVRRFLDATSRHLTPMVLQFIACNHEENKRLAQTKKSKKNPDAKLIPDLIFQIEQYDVMIIKLSKLCKTVNFSRWCERRQARDFKINADKVMSVLPQDHEEEDDTQSEHRSYSDDESKSAAATNDDDDEIPVDHDMAAHVDENEESNEYVDDDVPATARQADEDDEEDENEIASRHVKRRRVVGE
ncbi:hypothetical protein AeNC1_004488 [Aphanomyces euteiches]|nr:hypothetical protein AeNC1_004488 [Aphanomyces euteiches]